MKKIILHEMIIDRQRREVRVGEEIEIDPSQIEEIHSIRAWVYGKYLPDDERRKVVQKTIGGTGTAITINLSGMLKVYNVIESHQYIARLMKDS